MALNCDMRLRSATAEMHVKLPSHPTFLNTDLVALKLENYEIWERELIFIYKKCVLGISPVAMGLNVLLWLCSCHISSMALDTFYLAQWQQICFVLHYVYT